MFSATTLNYLNLMNVRPWIDKTSAALPLSYIAYCDSASEQARQFLEQVGYFSKIKVLSATELPGQHLLGVHLGQGEAKICMSNGQALSFSLDKALETSSEKKRIYQFITSC